jgi:hypothetical protein
VHINRVVKTSGIDRILDRGVIGVRVIHPVVIHVEIARRRVGGEGAEEQGKEESEDG